MLLKALVSMHNPSAYAPSSVEKQNFACHVLSLIQR